MNFSIVLFNFEAYVMSHIMAQSSQETMTVLVYLLAH
jgi:hypothetical protein